MAEEDSIIIKKIKKGGHGHHGGAWKVAYADFVTAMMAFFLLMWLLNATEAENLAGLADYFAPTVGVQGEMGIGFRGGKGVLAQGIGADKNTNKGIVFGGVPSGPIMKVTEKIELVTEEVDAEKIKLIIGSASEEEQQEKSEFSEMAQAVEDYINEVVESSGAAETVSVQVISEGLEIQISDSKKAPMFVGDTAVLQDRIKIALEQLAVIIGYLPNYISITGHTSSLAILSDDVEYGKWELSLDRANAARKFIVSAGVQAEQVAKVIGKADNDPADVGSPEAAANNRISFVLLRSAKISDHKKGAPKGIFLDPEMSGHKELGDVPSDVGDDTGVKHDGGASKGNGRDTNLEKSILEMEVGDEEDEPSDDVIKSNVTH